MGVHRRPRELFLGLDAFPTRTPTLPPATHTNSYALGTRDVLLVEPAPEDEGEQRAWVEWARGLASRGRNAVAIVLTHHHRDHIGGAELLARELGLPIWAHAATAQRLPHLRVERMLVEGDELPLDGPRPEAWKVLHTPGHAPGHVCLWNAEDGTVIVGDMVASVGTILIAPGDGDMVEYLAQLQRLEALGARVALPAHGDPIDEPSRLFRHYVVHRLLRENKVLGAVQAHPEGASATTLLPEVYADTSKTQWPFALLSLESHLTKLVKDGKIEARSDGTFVPRQSAPTP